MLDWLQLIRQKKCGHAKIKERKWIMKKGKGKFDDSFKKQLVELYNNGKPASEIELEYHVSNSALYKWIRYYNSTGSFKEKDNKSELEKSYKELERENRQLKMENDILKQAALIMGRK